MLNNPDVRNWISITLASILACGSGMIDAFKFHYFGQNVDLILFMGGLGALGVHVTAVNTASSIAKAADRIAKQ